MILLVGVSFLLREAPPTGLHRDNTVDTMKFLLLLVFSTIALVFGAPTQTEEKLKLLQEQLTALQKEIGPQVNYNKDVERPAFPEYNQMQKRLVAWQPMKRSQDERTPLLHAIEARLSEVLRAGERLGISADEVLQDLRYRNQK